MNGVSESDPEHFSSGSTEDAGGGISRFPLGYHPVSSRSACTPRIGQLLDLELSSGGNPRRNPTAAKNPLFLNSRVFDGDIHGTDRVEELIPVPIGLEIL
jgi:hypothetical protein